MIITVCASQVFDVITVDCMTIKTMHESNRYIGPRHWLGLNPIVLACCQMSNAGGRGVTPSFVHYIQEAYRPIVMTIASPEVNRLCQKNHLSFTEMLRPLGHELQGVGSTYTNCLCAYVPAVLFLWPLM
jgi:hypothetical protein